MKFPSLLGRSLAWWRQTRCKWLLVMTVLCLGLRENYPFSNFPMYSSFASHTYFLYLTDANEKAIKTRSFRLSSSGLKKIFDRYRRLELDRFKQAGSARVLLAEMRAGQSLVHYLEGVAIGRPAMSRLLDGLRVKHVQVRQRGDAIHLETRELAQHP